jgi:hypothetical protein
MRRFEGSFSAPGASKCDLCLTSITHVANTSIHVGAFDPGAFDRETALLCLSPPRWNLEGLTAPFDSGLSTTGFVSLAFQLWLIGTSDFYTYGLDVGVAPHSS